jgi:hypothetical protein
MEVLTNKAGCTLQNNKMKNIQNILALSLLIVGSVAKAQTQEGLYFNLGKNFSSFSYTNKSAYSDKLAINGVGDAYEIGYSKPLKYKNFNTFKDFRYSGSITLNDYNTIAESAVNHLEWKTTYLGLQNTVDYQFYDAFHFFLSAKAGLNVSTLLSGKQTINNSGYNLVHQNEFSGLVVQPLVGIYAKYYLSKKGYLSMGCNLSKSVKLGNNTDHVSINNTQILFGGYFDLIKR